jgi:hypothetical protein
MVGMDLEGGRYFFNAVREGDSVLFASDDENECNLWVMALYRATGQSHKPTPPISVGQNSSSISKLQGDTDKARKHGMEEYINKGECRNVALVTPNVILSLSLASTRSMSV